jgi:hypothetical protein
LAIVYKHSNNYECHVFSSDEPSQLEEFCHQLNDILSTRNLSRASSLTSIIDDKSNDHSFTTECDYCGSSTIRSASSSDIREVHRIIYMHQDKGNVDYLLFKCNSKSFELFLKFCNMTPYVFRFMTHFVIRPHVVLI